MCVQSYYNENRNQKKEIELDLLKEIKDFGIDRWNEQTNKREKQEVKKDEKIITTEDLKNVLSEIGRVGRFFGYPNLFDEQFFFVIHIIQNVFRFPLRPLFPEEYSYSLINHKHSRKKG